MNYFLMCLSLLHCVTACGNHAHFRCCLLPRRQTDYCLKTEKPIYSPSVWLPSKIFYMYMSYLLNGITRGTNTCSGKIWGQLVSTEATQQRWSFISTVAKLDEVKRAVTKWTKFQSWNFLCGTEGITSVLKCWENWKFNWRVNYWKLPGVFNVEVSEDDMNHVISWCTHTPCAEVRVIICRWPAMVGDYFRCRYTVVT